MGLMIFSLLLLVLATVVFKIVPVTKQVRDRMTGDTIEVDNPVGVAVNKAKSAVYGVILAVFGLGFFNGMWFYAEPGYQYHVKTIWGDEYVVSETGWAINGFKDPQEWKKAVSVVLTNETEQNGEPIRASYVGTAYKSRLLDNVDAEIDSTVRFRLPSGEEQFLAMAREYRTPENLINTALVPAVKQTLNATASLMTAEDYYAGSRTEFSNEFERQMAQGIYQVKRVERRVKTEQSQLASANATKGTDQDEYGDGYKTILAVEKLLGENGQPVVNQHNFSDFGVEVVSAVVTDLEPNVEFIQRMNDKQRAAAERAIAKEERMKEQEAKLLAEAKGQREVAEQKAAALKMQIKKTTDAETTKQLALTKANQAKEAAAIAEETMTIQLRTAKLEAKKIKELADAEAYKKREIMKANGQLEQKLATLEAINQVWAAAAQNMKVPTSVFMTGGGSGDGTGYPTGGVAAENFMNLMNMKAAKDLSVDLSTK